MCGGLWGHVDYGGAGGQTSRQVGGEGAEAEDGMTKGREARSGHQLLVRRKYMVQGRRRGAGAGRVSRASSGRNLDLSPERWEITKVFSGRGTG